MTSIESASFKAGSSTAIAAHWLAHRAILRWYLNEWALPATALGSTTRDRRTTDGGNSKLAFSE